jgi:hypothetical protein
MKNKFLLMFLAIGGLLIGVNSYYKPTAVTTRANAGLSKTITNLIELDPNSQSLVEESISRALSVKDINKNNSPTINQELEPVGKMKVDSK